MTADKDFACVGAHQADDHADGAGLAGAVRTDETINIPLANLQAEPVHRRFARPVTPGHLRNLDHALHLTILAPALNRRSLRFSAALRIGR